MAPEVAETMAAALRDVYGNASSVHSPGQLARHKLETSRREIAAFLHATAPEFVFTSGGTESNNLAVLGVARYVDVTAKHIVTTRIEHPAVFEACRQLEREGVQVTYVDPDKAGSISVEEIRCHLRASTVLVSVMHANNELGTIQPIAAIGRLVKERRGAGQKIYFHSDGVQAPGKIDVDVQELGVDLYALSAHKMFAPKGVGGLFVRKGTPLRGIQHGGRHERERRAGTENVPGAMAFARAARLYDAESGKYLAGLREQFEAGLLRKLPEARINGASAERLPNTSNVLFPGVSGESLVIALDMAGIAVSSGSACSSGSTEPSHVLLAIGLSPEEARSSVRFSFGRYNTVDEIETLVDAVASAVRQLRRARPEARLVEA